MVHERYFFEIAIYRISHDWFNEGYERDLRRHWEQFIRLSGRTREQVSKELRLNVEQHFWETYGGPWQFNQAVGWLRLFVLGSQIRADLWMSAAKRLQRTARHQVRLLGKAFEIHCWPEQSSTEIRTEVEEELLRFQREFRKGRLVLDLECFRIAAPCMDWRRLIGFTHYHAA